MKETTEAPEAIEGEEMNDSEMDSLLRQLHDSRTWEAIQRLVSLHDARCIAGCATIDPFKDPTLLAKAQGMRQGIYLLETYILNLLEGAQEKED